MDRRLEAEQHADRAGRRPAPARRRPPRWPRATPASSSRQRSGAWSTWMSENDSGRPDTSAIRRSRAELARVAEVGVALEHARARPSPIASAMPSSSASAAVRLGVNRPSAARCLRRARGREAERAGLERLDHEPSHLADLVGGGHLGVVGAAVAHHVEAQRGVRHLGADVHDPRRARRARRGTRGSDSHRKSMPSASTVPGMSSTPSIRLIRKSSAPGRTGAKPTEQLPNTVVVTPCQRRGRELGVPRGLAVVVGVDVDPAGQRRAARRRRARAGRGSSTRPDLDDAAAVDGHVGRRAGGRRCRRPPCRRGSPDRPRALPSSPAHFPAGRRQIVVSVTIVSARSDARDRGGRG